MTFIHEASPWFDHYTNDIELGDLIEFKNMNEETNHYGIYIGESQNKKHCVVHLLNGPLTMFSTPNFLKTAIEATNRSNAIANNYDATIELDELESLFKIVGCRVRQNNTSDNKWLPMDKMKIVEMARSFVNMDSDIIKRYNLFGYNCKQFANFCRYGQCDEMLNCKKEPIITSTFYQKKKAAYVMGLILGLLGIVLGIGASTTVLSCSVNNAATGVGSFILSFIGYGFGGAVGVAAFYVPFIFFNYPFL